MNFIDGKAYKMMETERKAHWERVYEARTAEAMSWYQAHALMSMELIRATGIDRSAPVIDVGGGASTLVDDLHAAGYTSLAVLDFSSTALDAARRRLGPEVASTITWIEADITRAELPDDAYEIWHDRAVFHFLTSVEDREHYVSTMRGAVRPGGWVVMATFADDGPDKCSRLPVVRYRPDTLSAELGVSFVLERHARELHVTPGGATQSFLYCLFRKL